MQTLEFILSTLLIIAVWRFVVRRSLLDQARDQLFDIRDSLRRSYVSNGWALNSIEYKQARDLINAHLHFTESMSAWQIFSLQAGMARNEQLRKYVQHKYETMFAGVPQEQAEVLQKHRRASLQVVTSYAVTNSLVLVSAGLLILPFIVLERMLSAAKRGASTFFHVGSRSIAGLGQTTANLIGRAAKLVIQPQAIEQCSVYSWSH